MRRRRGRRRLILHLLRLDDLAFSYILSFGSCNISKTLERSDSLTLNTFVSIKRASVKYFVVMSIEIRTKSWHII